MFRSYNTDTVFKVLFVISREKIVVQDTSKLIFAHGFLCHLAQHSLETPSEKSKDCQDVILHVIPLCICL